MEGEAGILQQRVETVPLRRRHIEPREGVGGEQQKSEESERNQSLRADSGGQRPCRQPTLEQRHRSPRQRQDCHPEQHRSFVIAPRARDPVDRRQSRRAIFGHQLHRQIGVPEDQQQRGKGGRRHQRLHDRDRPHCADQRLSTLGQRPEPHQRLQQRQGGGDPQRGKPCLGDHRFRLLVSCIAPATSGGIYFSSCLARMVSAANWLCAVKRPSATTPDPSRNRSGTMPV